MLTASVAALLALAPVVPAADAPAPTRVLVLETRADAAVLSQVKDFGDLFATILEQRSDAEIIPSSSIKDRLQVAAAKVESGCDDTACMTEIAGAMDARYVVASRASQVGGRWLMRIELFDSQDLKVIAQATAMADSVGGLAAQAEHLSDDLLAKAPVLPRKGSSSSSSPSGPTNAATVNEIPPPDQKSGGLSPGLLIGGGVASTLVSVGAGIAGLYGYGDFLNKKSSHEIAITDYENDPSSSNREALVQAASAKDGSASINNCLWFPIGIASPLLCIGGIGVAGWGAVEALSSNNGEE